MLAAAGGAAGSVDAAPVPITVHVEGEQLRSVDLIDNGISPFTKIADGRYQRTIDSDSLLPKSHVINFGYPAFNHAMVLRLHRYSKPVSFPVALAAITSCTNARVTAVEKYVSTLRDAINSALLAAKLLSINGNDSCDRSLAARAARAVFRNSVRVNQLSMGLFAIPEDTASAYIAASTDRDRARNEVAAYRKMEIGLEGVQLVAARNEAQSLGNFGQAADIQQAIADRSSQGRDIELAFAAEGLSKEVILTDSAYLEKMTLDQSEQQAEIRPADDSEPR